MDEKYVSRKRFMLNGTPVVPGQDVTRSLRTVAPQLIQQWRLRGYIQLVRPAAKAQVKPQAQEGGLLR